MDGHLKNGEYSEEKKDKSHSQSIIVVEYDHDLKRKSDDQKNDSDQD